MISVKKKMMLAPDRLKINPLNKRVYTNKEEEKRVVEKLAADFKKRIEDGLTPNIQPILIWKDGLIDAGNTRGKASKMVGCDMWCEYTEAPYPNEDKPYTNFLQLESSNVYRKKTHSVKLQLFEEANRAYTIEYGYSRSRKDEDIHIQSLGTSRQTINQLREVKHKMPELLKLVDEGNMAVKAAYDEATGKNKPKVIKSNNPNRDWSSIYNDDFFKPLMNRVFNITNGMLDMPTKINGEDFFPFKDFTKGSIAGNISHLMETIGAELLRSEGHNVKAATGHPTDPDIYHIDLDDKIEIKVTNFNGSSTKWKGGFGIREGQYILMTYDETIERCCIIFTPLTEKDWKSAGMGGTTLTMQKVYENHKDDMVVAYGEIFETGGKLQIQLEKI